MALSDIIKNKLRLLFFRYKQIQAKKINTDKVEYIIIHGFWRSGTTFLLEFLQSAYHTNLAFEPWNEVVPESKELMDELNITHDKFFRRLYMPSLDFTNEKVFLWGKDVVKCNLSGNWVRTPIKFEQIGTYTKKRTIIKFVNAAFFLEQFNYKGKVLKIILIRDLISTMDSFKKTTWTNWFKELSLMECIPQAFFQKYGHTFNDLIAWAQSHDLILIRIGAFKLLTDYYAVRNANRDDTLVIDYSELTRDPVKILTKVSDFSGWRVLEKNVVLKSRRASAMTVKNARSKSGEYSKKELTLTTTEIEELTKLQLLFKKKITY